MLYAEGYFSYGGNVNIFKKIINKSVLLFKKWKRKKKADKTRVFNWLWEFSKKIVVVLALYYFVQSVCVVLMIKINPDSTALSTLITETNETFRVCIGGYLLKAGIENTIKLKNAKFAKKNNLVIERTNDYE